MLCVLLLGHTFAEPAYTVTVNNLTNYVVATSTNSAPSTAFDVRKFSSVSFYPRFQMRNASTGTVLFKVEFSADATYFVTTSNHTFRVTADGVNFVNGFETISLGNYAYMRIAQIANTNSVDATNISVKVVLK